MANFKYNTNEQGMFLAVSFGEQIFQGTIGYAIYDIVENYMDRFTLRGKSKVNAQWLLYCCVYNIGKTANIIFNFTENI